MKRYNNLYEKIIDKENIRLAIHKASNKKRKRKSVIRVLENEDKCVEEIYDMLSNQTYLPNSYIKRRIKDGAGKKERIIYIPKFYPDQVIHWAIMLQIEPLLRKRMYYYSCASIKGKGTYFGVQYVKKCVQKYKYVLKMDIQKYYPSINKENLKLKFTRFTKDKRLIWLLNEIIDSGDKGIPIGNYTSQWFANFYLTDVDYYIKHELKIRDYIRYNDDMILFSNNKRKLHKSLVQLDERLMREDLKIKYNWQVFSIYDRPLDFLGYRFYNGYTTLRRGNFLRIKRRFKRINKKGLTYKNACAVISYNGILKHSNCHTYKTNYMYPYVSIKNSKKVISDESKKQY